MKWATKQDVMDRHYQASIENLETDPNEDPPRIKEWVCYFVMLGLAGCIVWAVVEALMRHVGGK